MTEGHLDLLQRPGGQTSKVAQVEGYGNLHIKRGAALRGKDHGRAMNKRRRNINNIHGGLAGSAVAEIVHNGERDTINPQEEWRCTTGTLSHTVSLQHCTRGEISHARQIHSHTHTYMHAHTHTRTHARTHTRTHTHTYTHAHAHTQTLA